MRRFVILTVLFWLIVFISGCASTMNPYDSEFTCPYAEKGKCVSLQTAYEESMKDNSGGKALREELNGRDSDKLQEQKPSTADDPTYRTALYKKVTNLLENPETPMVVTSQALRVLIFPYRADDNMLFMQRYVYFFLDQPKWVLDNLEAEPMGVQ